MKILNVEVKGNGERAIIKSKIDGHLYEGRLFLVRPGTYDLLTDAGKSMRFSLGTIADFSLQ